MKKFYQNQKPIANGRKKTKVTPCSVMSMLEYISTT